MAVERLEGRLDSEGRTLAEELVDKIIDLALAGDRQVIKELWFRLEGRAPQVVKPEDNWRDEPDPDLPKILDALGYMPKPEFASDPYRGLGSDNHWNRNVR